MQCASPEVSSVLVIRDLDGIAADAIGQLRATGLDPARSVVLVSVDPPTDVEKLSPSSILIELVADPGVLGEHGLGVVERLWARGRWRFDSAGPGGDAGTTQLDQREDPLLTAARLILAARESAYQYGCLATADRIETFPGTPGRIPESVRLWVDACGPDDADLLGLVQELVQLAAQAGARAAEESWTPSIVLDPALRDRIAGRGGLPLVTMNADAGPALADVPRGVLVVREDAHDAARAVLLDLMVTLGS